VAINIVGVSGKNFSSLGKIVVCPEKFFDSQTGTLTENFFGDRGCRRKKFLSRGPKVAEKGPRHKICLRALCSSVTLLSPGSREFDVLGLPCGGAFDNGVRNLNRKS
jgi:hypothetical protein